MLSKDEFVRVIDFIQEKDKLQAKFCDVLEDLSTGFVDAFIYDDYENLVIKLLNNCLNLDEKDETITYFIADLDFGKKYYDGCFTDVDTLENIDISTAEKLYDYLTKEVSHA